MTFLQIFVVKKFLSWVNFKLRENYMGREWVKLTAAGIKICEILPTTIFSNKKNV